MGIEVSLRWKPNASWEVEASREGETYRSKYRSAHLQKVDAFTGTYVASRNFWILVGYAPIAQQQL